MLLQVPGISRQYLRQYLAAETATCPNVYFEQVFVSLEKFIFKQNV